MLSFVTEKSRFGSGPVMFVGRAVGLHTCTMEDVYQREKAEDPSLTREAFFGPAKRIAHGVCALLAEGNAVKTNLFTAKPVVKGKAEEELLSAPGQFTVGVSVSPEKALVKAASGVKLQRDEGLSRLPRIKSVFDEASKTYDTRLTAGKKLTILGVKIKVHGAHPDVGLHFVNPDTGEDIKLAVDDLAVNEVNRIIVMTPQETAGGRWQVKVVTQAIGSSVEKQRKEPLVLTFEPVLSA